MPDGLIDILARRGADPWVIRHYDHYWYIGSGRGGLTLSKSQTLAGLSTADRVRVWTPPPTGPNSRELWAPELHVVDGKWTIYYAADDGQNKNHRMFVLQTDGDDATQSPFKDLGKLHLPDDRWAIDGTTFELGGQRFHCWSGWEGDTDVEQLLYIAKMDGPTGIVGPRVVISRPTLKWEQNGGRPLVNEGPTFLAHGGKGHIIYSASGSWSDFYCLGRLTIDLNTDPMKPEHWHKHEQPAFAGTDQIISPGHASFVNVAEDGDRPWIVYHCARHFGAGWDRYVRAQRFSWNANDTPDFGKPLPPIGREH